MPSRARAWQRWPIPRARACPRPWLRSPPPQRPCDMPLSSRHEITVEWGDCDPAGIVYYPAYFRWSDQSTHRLFANAGIERDEMRGGPWKEGTPPVSAECSFKRPSQPGEKLIVESRVSRFGRSSFTISHVFRDASGEI